MSLALFETPLILNHVNLGVLGLLGLMALLVSGSVLVPSSAHLAWLCLIDFQDLVKVHLEGKAAQLPPWLLKHLECLGLALFFEAFVKA